MAYIFPINPYDGQLYPVPAAPGALQYQWSASAKVWFIYSPLGVQSVSGIVPIVVSNGTSDAVISILPATINTAGAMSAQDKSKLDNIPANAGIGTVTRVETGNGLTGGPITTTGSITLKPATATTLGGVKVGTNIQVDNDGTISVPTASLGVTAINLGPGLIGSPSPILTTGTISAALATRLTVGSIRVGNGLSITQDGTLSVGGSLGDVGVLAWGTVQVSPAVPYVFTVVEGFNISSVEWRGVDPAPRARVYFQRPLANSLYGTLCTAQAYNHDVAQAYYQEAININSTYKEVSYVDLECMVTQTTDYRVDGSGVNYWNKWNLIYEFDIMIVDKAVY